MKEDTMNDPDRISCGTGTARKYEDFIIDEAVKRFNGLHKQGFNPEFAKQNYINDLKKGGIGGAERLVERAYLKFKEEL